MSMRDTAPVTNDKDYRRMEGEGGWMNAGKSLLKVSIKLKLTFIDSYG